MASRCPKVTEGASISVLVTAVQAYERLATGKILVQSVIIVGDLVPINDLTRIWMSRFQAPGTTQ
jgi:hypothetical protein